MSQSGGSISDVLRSVDIPVVSDADCDSAYGGLRTNKNEIRRNCLLRFKFLFLSSGTASSPSVFPSMMCAGDTANGNITLLIKINLLKRKYLQGKKF
jgi:trypsin